MSSVVKFTIGVFNYIKLGCYSKRLGGLIFEQTNQQFYYVENQKMIDITNVFYK